MPINRHFSFPHPFGCSRTGHTSWPSACGALLFLITVLLSSCVTEETFDDTQKGNFEALWKIMDEHYCFFDEKGIDWDSVHTAYARQVDGTMNDTQLLEVLANMLAELRDGHVNLYTSFDMARYWGFHENYPSNYSDTLVDKYLGTDYKIAGGLSYRILDDNIGYVRCASFASEAGSGNLDNVLLYLAPCRGIIIDLRDNGGGLLTAAEKLAARFTNEKRLVGYMRHKTGRGHNDFSSMEEQWLKPASGLRWQKPVAVLTNRQVFSAANEFVKYMKCCPGSSSWATRLAAVLASPSPPNCPTVGACVSRRAPCTMPASRAQSKASPPTSGWISMQTIWPPGATPSSRPHARR